MLTSALKAQFIEMSRADARALSWGGLKGTSMWNQLSDADQLSIGQTIMVYSDKDRYDKKAHTVIK